MSKEITIKQVERNHKIKELKIKVWLLSLEGVKIEPIHNRYGAQTIFRIESAQFLVHQVVRTKATFTISFPAERVAEISKALLNFSDCSTKGVEIKNVTHYTDTVPTVDWLKVRGGKSKLLWKLNFYIYLEDDQYVQTNK